MHSKLDGNQYGITIFRQSAARREEREQGCWADEDDGDGGHFVCCQRQKHLIANVEELRSREMSGMRFVGRENVRERKSYRFHVGAGEEEQQS